MKYALIDTANSFSRAKHVANKNSDLSEKIGMSLHLTLASCNQIFRKFDIDHFIFATEGRSWRKDFYKPYKANRAVAALDQTETEVAESKMFWEVYESFTSYLRDKTNVSLLRNPNAEADDIIARFIHLHPDDEHFIISSDTDFLQLIAKNVKQYNGITNQLITTEGYFDDRGRILKDKKTKEPKLLGDPQYILFKKCIRGDSTDNVFSAFPEVREKGSKNKVGLIEAYADKDAQGFQWNNLMLQRWSDHNDVEHRVKDDYERNKILIDLTAQPQEIKDAVDNSIRSGFRVDKVSNVGIHLMKFAVKHELTKISQQADSYARWLNAPYPGNQNVQAS